jgi:hypothetical protein
MALNASSKLRPKVIAMQKRGIALILERAGSAGEKGALSGIKARETYCAPVRVRPKRTTEAES